MVSRRVLCVTRVPLTSLLLSNLVLHPTTYLGPELAFTMNLSSSNCLKTSPIICPIDCSAFKSSSVLSSVFESQSTRTSTRALSRPIPTFSTARARHHRQSLSRSPRLFSSRARASLASSRLAISPRTTLCCNNNPAYFLNASRRGSGGGAAGSLGVVAIASAFVTGVAGVCAWSSSPSVVVISPFDRSRALAL